MSNINTVSRPKDQAQSPLWHALKLAEQGRAVFPVSPQTKRPACPHGVKDATTDPSTIRQWFTQPGLVPAISTGERSGIAALDIDTPAGLPWWQANRDRLPATRTHRTRSGGLHLWFNHRPGLRSSVAVIAPGIDVRADGGSCIWWPAAGHPVLLDGPLADWPSWLMPPPKPAWTPPEAPAWAGDDRKARAYALAALKRGVETVASAAPGTRNATLNRETFALLRLVPSGGVTFAEIAEGLAYAAFAAGLDRQEIETTIRSALRARSAR